MSKKPTKKQLSEMFNQFVGREVTVTPAVPSRGLSLGQPMQIDPAGLILPEIESLAKKNGWFVGVRLESKKKPPHEASLHYFKADIVVKIAEQDNGTYRIRRIDHDRYPRGF